MIAICSLKAYVPLMNECISISYMYICNICMHLYYKLSLLKFSILGIAVVCHAGHKGEEYGCSQERFQLEYLHYMWETANQYTQSATPCEHHPQRHLSLQVYGVWPWFFKHRQPDQPHEAPHGGEVHMWLLQEEIHLQTEMPGT